MTVHFTVRLSTLRWLALPLFLLLIGTPALLRAALPPQYEAWREFGAVTSAGEIADKLDRRGIIVDKIERDLQTGAFRISGENCSVVATIVSGDPFTDESGVPFSGPVRITGVKVGDVTCK